MKLKVLAIVTGALVLLAAGAMVLDWQRNKPEFAERVGDPLLTAADMSDAARVELQGPKDSVTLELGDDGTWVVKEQDFAADGKKLTGLMVKMTGATLDHMVTDNPEKLGDLGLLTPEENGGKAEDGKTATRFAIYNEGGKAVYEVLLGNNRAGSGGPTTFGGQYVRFPGSKVAYLIGESLFVESKPEDWIDKVVFDVSADKTLKSIRIAAPGSKPYTLARKSEEDKWTLDNLKPDAVKQDQAKTLGNQLAALDIARVAPAGADAKALGRKVTGTTEVTFFDKRRFTITVGKDKGPDDYRYITLSASLPDDVKDQALRDKVQAFNAKYRGHTFALHAWDAGRLQRARKDFMVGSDQ